MRSPSEADRFVLDCGGLRFRLQRPQSTHRPPPIANRSTTRHSRRGASHRYQATSPRGLWRPGGVVSNMPSRNRDKLCCQTRRGSLMIVDNAGNRLNSRSYECANDIVANPNPSTDIRKDTRDHSKDPTSKPSCRCCIVADSGAQTLVFYRDGIYR